MYVIADHWKRLEHYAVHAERIKRWGEWFPIAMDYASGLNARTARRSSRSTVKCAPEQSDLQREQVLARRRDGSL
jgi:hypothetical protein